MAKALSEASFEAIFLLRKEFAWIKTRLRKDIWLHPC